MTRRGTVIIFLKAPVAGRVKTRLGRALGMTTAAWWFRHQSSRLIRRLSSDARWDVVLSVSPDGAAGPWPAHIPRWPQGRGDLGARMRRALTRTRPGPAVLIGADIPGVTPAHIDRAFKALRGHDAVFGPARDGGFWLIGLARGAMAVPRGALRDVHWSSENALHQSAGTLAPLRIAYADTLDDVDTADDLRAHRRATRLLD